MSAACWHLPGSGSRLPQNLRHQPDRPQCTPRQYVRIRDERHLPRGSTHCEPARRPNDRDSVLDTSLQNHR
ncbi:hypothetical protein GGD66_007944 [Bradyrhizobium sp. CIR48]|nr:hypothetical protein [Bradyrhizobium sp. CIR18]MBB4429342.1 hypothetical protein [Bradyrhizobium sp. CIR48]